MMILFNRSYKLLLTAILFLLAFVSAPAAERSDTLSVTISFRQSKYRLDTAYMDNGAALRRFKQAYDSLPAEKSEVHVIGYASPEGTLKFNRFLSKTRAEVIIDFLKNELSIPAEKIIADSIGVDWPGLYEAVIADPNVPQRDKVLQIISTVPEIVYGSDGQWITGRKHQLMDLDRGRPWNYMLQNIYPYLRGAQAELYCTTRTMEPAVVTPAPKPAPLYEPEAAEEAQEAPMVVQEKPRYWSIHTNMLYDALAIPNAGAEVYLGRNFSLAANWWYAWWKTDRQHRYWRTYGGYIAPRYWFGKAAHAKPLTGHHLGLYGQMMLYDFEWGGIGNLSGTPGKNIFHHPTWGGGIEYGFALPIKRRLNLDFTIGLGYLRGRYWKYEPMDDHYVWISKHIRNWWGPTKVEVSLVWLLGRDNVNKQKGGVK